MFIGAHVLMALLMITGPIFIACALFPASRQFFSGMARDNRWRPGDTGSRDRTHVAYDTVQQSELIKVQAAPAGADIMGQIGSLIGVAGLLFICAGMAKQIPGIAAGIAGERITKLATLSVLRPEP